MAQPGDRRGVAFAAIVVVIAAVGIYLTMWPDTPDQAEPDSQAGRTAGPAVASSTPLATASAAPFDVYSYLPMTKEQLAAAADLAERFTAAYGTFRYDEDPAAYADRVKVYTTPGLANTLTRTITSAGTVQQNRDDQVVSTATARLKEIRQIEKSSVVFLITATRQVAAKSGPKHVSEEYAVTVSQSASDWRIYDILPASAGQKGDETG